MNKYIRTKDGRILEWGKLNELTKLSIDICEETIEEADTIEELCDEFVLVKDNYKTLLELEANRTIKNGFLKDIKSDWLSYIDDYLEQGSELYGAIWTDKGLIYVAKINDKGELEII